MSIKSAIKFIERMGADQEFYRKSVACRDASERMAFATEEGFDFTPEEMQNALQSKNNEELTDAELELISGGGCYDDWLECSFLPPCNESAGDCHRE